MSATTRETCHRTVREFTPFLGRALVSASPEDMRRWRGDLANRGQRPATMAREPSTVRSLYAYFEAGWYDRRNPASPKLVLPPEICYAKLSVKSRQPDFRDRDWSGTGQFAVRAEACRTTAVLSGTALAGMCR